MLKLESLLRLDGKIAIVTGGSKGIGKAIAYRLAEAGSSVIIADNDKEASSQTVRELKDLNFSVHEYILDVSEESQIKNLMDFGKKEFGKIDILVNNAGIFPTATLENISTDLYEKVHKINTFSVFTATKYVSEIMKENGGGKIINITSIDAIHPSSVGLAHYDASKHAVWGFTKNVALELAPYNITVNAIAPGAIDTPGLRKLTSEPNNQQDISSSIPLGRLGDPDDIGLATLFLASNMSSYIAGSQLVVDGGALLA